MSVTRVLARGRRRRTALMLDSCRITRAGGEPVFDPETGQYVTPEPVVVYEGRCQVKPRINSTEVQAGQQEVALHTYDVALPFPTTAAIAVNDAFTVTESSDTWLQDRPNLVVTAVEVATARTAHWIAIDDRSS